MSKALQTLTPAVPVSAAATSIPVPAAGPPVPIPVPVPAAATPIHIPFAAAAALPVAITIAITAAVSISVPVPVPVAIAIPVSVSAMVSIPVTVPATVSVPVIILRSYMQVRLRTRLHNRLPQWIAAHQCVTQKPRPAGTLDGLAVVCCSHYSRNRTPHNSSLSHVCGQCPYLRAWLTLGLCSVLILQTLTRLSANTHLTRHEIKS